MNNYRKTLASFNLSNNFILLLIALFWNLFIPNLAYADTYTNIFSDNFNDTNGISLSNHNSNWSILQRQATIENNTLVTANNTFIELTNVQPYLNQCVSVDLLFPLSQIATLYARFGGVVGHEYFTFINTDNTSQIGWADNNNGAVYFGNGAQGVSPTAGWHNFKL